MKPIIFEPIYSIGDVVALRIALDKKMVICGYSIKQYNSTGEVTFFRYSLYDEAGAEFYYSESDLQLLESVKKD